MATKIYSHLLCKKYNPKAINTTMKYLQKNIVFLLLFFYATSSYLSATHMHSCKALSKSDCKICIMSKNIHSNTPSLQYPIEHIDICSLISSINTTHTIAFVLKGYLSNAPPVFIF